MISVVDKAVFTCLVTAGPINEGGSAESCDGGKKWFLTQLKMVNFHYSVHVKD